MRGLILAAGGGTRLRPLTDERPKCLVPVLGQPIVFNALEALCAVGCDRVTIVVGHKAEVLEEQLGGAYKDMAVEYVVNDVWDQTNSMYSLHLGLQHHPADYVLEGDVFFDHGFLKKPPLGEITWVVDSTYRESDGSYLRIDANGFVIEQQIVKDQTTLSEHWAKSVGMLFLTTLGNERLGQWLRAAVEKGQEKLYYDLIVAEHLGDRIVGSVDISPGKWFEIDTVQDLENAERLFG